MRGALRVLARGQRPVAWLSLVGGIIVFVGVALDLIQAGEFKLLTLIGAFMVLQQGWDAVVTVENELDSEGSAEP